MTITTVLLSLLFLLLLAAASGAQGVIVLPKLGAVAEKIGEVAVDLGSAQFSMVLRLVIHDTVHNNGHSCLTRPFARHSFEKQKNHLFQAGLKKQVRLAFKLQRKDRNVL